MKCDTPFYVQPKAAFDKVPVPCGRCPNCKKRRVDEWAFRLMQEYKRSTSAYFITFTYNNENVPITENGFMTLDKSHFQEFMKSFRKTQKTKIKYYCAGEYGGQRHRPHYHAIMFNIEDLSALEKAWTKGSIYVGKVTQDSCAYTLKYIDKFTDKKQRHERDDREFEFSLMSKKLGENFLTEEMRKYYKSDVTRLSVKTDLGYEIAIPRYYKKKLFNEYETKFQQKYIDTVMKEQENKELMLWMSQNQGKTEDDYSKFIMSQKAQRWAKFYHHSKHKRNECDSESVQQ